MCIPHAFKKDVPPGSKVDHFDRGRAELFIKMFCPYDLSDVDVFQLVRALFEASRGNPDVKALLLDAPFDWLPSKLAAALSAMYEIYWNAFQQAPPALDGLRALREMCLHQEHPWPETMVAALFDEPSFDAEAFVDFGKTSD